MNLVTVKTFAQKYPCISEGAMRDCLFYNPEEFRGRCTLKLGRKVLIKEEAFLEWIQEVGSKPGFKVKGGRNEK